MKAVLSVIFLAFAFVGAAEAFDYSAACKADLSKVKKETAAYKNTFNDTNKECVASNKFSTTTNFTLCETGLVDYNNNVKASAQAQVCGITLEYKLEGADTKGKTFAFDVLPNSCVSSSDDMKLLVEHYKQKLCGAAAVAPKCNVTASAPTITIGCDILRLQAGAIAISVLVGLVVMCALTNMSMGFRVYRQRLREEGEYVNVEASPASGVAEVDYTRLPPMGGDDA